MNHLQVFVSACFIAWSSAAWGHDFEVLFPYSLGRDAMDFDSKFSVSAEARTFLVDGGVESVGTESITYDRSLIAHSRVVTNAPITDRLAIRAVISVVGTFRKVEGAEEPRTIKEELFYDAKPRLEVTFFTQNSLEVFGGVNYRLTSSFESKTESSEFITTEKYSGATMNYPHFGFVKRTGSFQGGFTFQQGAEKARSVEKTNDIDTSTLNLEDRIQDPTTLSIFTRTSIGKYGVYGEFSAVQAGEGGNKSDDGASVEEDYIKLTFQVTVPTPFFDVENTLIYKTLSYADSRNVTLKTIPQTGLHINLKRQVLGFDVYGGILFGYGSDGQSIDEFNANYTMNAAGAAAGAAISF
ncbi:hypothetical protein [Pseudobacteriovorax antillogorgiicola]|uniref:Uncharacterized protein n=1 Tax=Pseudobacteriovorax antillogorgiicola TaxID=1513793 RepID=A0A1Y6CDC5_9BACT|nr:hypothetical protein [Pseudobacteriovorax antillogorgiicola]TCS48606.1 hypothetical protein EDD56_11728 [Pseudobacteriovorax antillogorgiicola]SMF55526.1 hypothetical protein SAMN06296036_117131 [Pseudobacteriovorax antillogorgiicola]